MGSKEEKHIVMEFQKKILQEAGCSAEVIAFLDEIEDEVFCEYYCFCFLDGMPIEEVRRIDSVPVQNWKDKIKRIREERTGYLERLFVPDAQVTQQISKLHEKAGRVFKETEELRDTINTTLKQTLKIQEEALVQQKESYQSTLASKAELLKDREDKIQSLLSEIEQNKAVWENEKKDLLLKLEEKKTAVKEEEKKEIKEKILKITKSGTIYLRSTNCKDALRFRKNGQWINNFGYQGFITYEYSLKNPYEKPFDFTRVKV